MICLLYAFGYSEDSASSESSLLIGCPVVLVGTGGPHPVMANGVEILGNNEVTYTCVSEVLVALEESFFSWTWCKLWLRHLFPLFDFSPLTSPRVGGFLPRAK